MKGKVKKISLILIPVAMALIIVVGVLVNVLTLGKYDNILEQYIGKTDDKLAGDTKGANVKYVESSFDSPKSLYEYEEKLCAEIAQEGITLLENDGLLPLAKGTKLSLFSHSSVDLVSGGSGSGSGSFELTADLKTGLEAAGLQINTALWDFYKTGKGSGYKRGAGVINYGASLDWSVNECPLSVIQSQAWFRPLTELPQCSFYRVRAAKAATRREIWRLTAASRARTISNPTSASWK